MFDLVLFAIAASPSPSTSPASPDPYRVYAAAMRKLATLDQPAFIDDTERRVTVTESAASGDPMGTQEETDRAIFDSATRREIVFGEPGDREVVIGDSYFAPDTWLVGRGRPPLPSPAAPNMAPDLSDLKVIADVVAVESPAYQIRLEGTTSNSIGDTVYHLVLHPRRDPDKHNLRELWVDTKTNLIVRAIVQGRYRPMPREEIEKSFALEDFGQVGPYWLVVHRIWTWAPPSSGLLLRFEANVQTMRFPSSLPDWLFDERAFHAHAGDLQSVLGQP